MSLISLLTNKIVVLSLVGYIAAYYAYGVIGVLIYPFLSMAIGTIFNSIVFLAPLLTIQSLLLEITAPFYCKNGDCRTSPFYMEGI